MTRKIYSLTDKQIQKCEQAARFAQQRRQNADANRGKLGKRYGLECRQAALDALKGDQEYQRGLWQGRIDRANGLDYSEERLEKSFNLGYYRGWTEYESDLRGGLVIPAEYLN